MSVRESVNSPPQFAPFQVKVQSNPSKVCIILFFYRFCPGDRWWFMCWNQVHCLLLYVFTTFLPGNDYSTNTKKYKKMHFRFMWDFSPKCISKSYWWSVHVSMHTTNPVWMVDGSCDQLFREKNLNAVNGESKGSIPEVKGPAHS